MSQLNYFSTGHYYSVNISILETVESLLDVTQQWVPSNSTKIYLK